MSTSPIQAPVQTPANISVLGIVLGHIALGQIKRTGENGRGLAIAGLVIGYVAVGITVLVIISGVGAAASMHS